MARLILLLLCCVSLNAQSITVSGTTYQLTGDEIMSDPNTFLHQFIEDALERGHDFTGVQGTFALTGGTGGTKGYSVRTAACQGRYKIGLQRHFWNNFDSNAARISGASNLYEQRRHLVYHELGHALLRLNHVCYGSETRLGDRLHLDVTRDIMWAITPCNIKSPSNPTGTIDSYAYSHYPYSWTRHLNRMFDPRYQREYSCGSNKSSSPIIDYCKL